jgi:hypothetical protein
MRRFVLSLIVAAGCAHHPAPPAATPSAGPALVSLFDGKTLRGWEGDPVLWAVKDGAIDGVAEKGGKLIYTKDDYDSFRLIVKSRLVSETNHLGVCFWGQRLPDFGYGQCVLVIPPAGGMWDYHPGRKSPPRQSLAHDKLDARVWHTSEILARFDTGEIRMAVNGVEVMRYKDIDPARLLKGPIGLQIHAGVSEVQYKDVQIERHPREDRLITVK